MSPLYFLPPPALLSVITSLFFGLHQLPRLVAPTAMVGRTNCHGCLHQLPRLLLQPAKTALTNTKIWLYQTRLSFLTFIIILQIIEYQRITNKLQIAPKKNTKNVTTY